MFDQLSNKILSSFESLRGKKRISEANIENSIGEIRRSLLEADVHFQVVKTFIDRVKEKSLGTKVISGVQPGEQFVRIIHDELVELLGKQSSGLQLTSKPSVLFLVGLQGTGKTTSAGKLALYIREQLKKNPGLVPADIYRPGAIEQLKLLGSQGGVPVFDTQVGQNPRKILKGARAWAQNLDLDVVLVDTAGRLQIDEALMTELSDMKKLWEPKEILLVADAMLGQQSVNVAQGFHQNLGLTGLILTKVDGDARGGAALSIRESTGVPIKFLGTGEKQSALEVFHPDRLAGRILDMGDVVSLVEKAQDVMDEKETLKQARRLEKGEYSLEDFLSQIKQMKKLGSMESLLKMLPGMGQLSRQMKDMAPPDEDLKKMEAMIQSMTLPERRDHRIINGSRRVRIAKGSGTRVNEVNKFIKKFEASKKMMTQMMKLGLGRG